ncbi:hypothetical protein DUI87_28319 [Hirundo rustica rustica]|uniref:Uncharacterized protein n=1 Tax=Hirundo rustica rustica TaxID=333673 RepID=A0A3M0J3H4_HIRRU|nr:hypothetical protein DUI87_28319 [Hirundo rustica rustica]
MNSRGHTEDSTFQTLEIWELFVTLALTDQSGWPFERRQGCEELLKDVLSPENSEPQHYQPQYVDYYYQVRGY